LAEKGSILDRLENLPIVVNVVNFLKTYSLPGLSEVPMYDVLSFIYNEAMKDDITTRASSVAFNFFLSLFPIIIFLFTLLPLLPFTTGYLIVVEESLKTILPGTAYEYLFGIISDVASIKRSGLLSIGFFLAIFFASSGVLTIMYGFDKSYEITFKQRSYLKKRLVALLLTIVLGALLILSVVFIIFGKQILKRMIDYFDIIEYGSLIFTMVRLFLVASIIYTGITIIYRYGPSMYKKISFWNSGAILATGLSILSSFAFSYFIDNFGRYNELYGSIGALIVIMIWMQINAFILLVGFELNASIAVNKDLRKQDIV